MQENSLMSMRLLVQDIKSTVIEILHDPLSIRQAGDFYQGSDQNRSV